MRGKKAQRAADRKLRLIIVDPLEMAMMEEKDKVFLAEIRKGVAMWEADDEEDE